MILDSTKQEVNSEAFFLALHKLVHIKSANYG